MKMGENDFVKIGNSGFRIIEVQNNNNNYNSILRKNTKSLTSLIKNKYKYYYAPSTYYKKFGYLFVICKILKTQYYNHVLNSININETLLEPHAENVTNFDISGDVLQSGGIVEIHNDNSNNIGIRFDNKQQEIQCMKELYNFYSNELFKNNNKAITTNQLHTIQSMFSNFFKSITDHNDSINNILNDTLNNILNDTSQNIKSSVEPNFLYFLLIPKYSEYFLNKLYNLMFIAIKNPKTVSDEIQTIINIFYKQMVAILRVLTDKNNNVDTYSQLINNEITSCEEQLIKNYYQFVDLSNKIEQNSPKNLEENLLNIFIENVYFLLKSDEDYNNAVRNVLSAQLRYKHRDRLKDDPGVKDGTFLAIVNKYFSEQ